jgi:hypothetical protein
MVYSGIHRLGAPNPNRSRGQSIPAPTSHKINRPSTNLAYMYMYTNHVALYVWVRGTKTTGPIAKMFFFKLNFFGIGKVSAQDLLK